MARKKTATLTEVELEFMQIIWQHPDITSESIRATLALDGREIADGAVRRMLAILMEKGYLIRHRDGKEYLYTPKVRKEQAISKIFGDLRKRLFGGSDALMVASLLDTLDISDQELAEFRRRLDEHGGEEV